MKNQQKIPLYQALVEHINKSPISFHVPGHKYGTIAKDYFEQILKLDATELSGLDDLHSPEGAILEAEQLLQDLYQTRSSFFLINGSTVGNLAMVMAACSENDCVLVQRNCHKSVVNGLQLAKVNPIFLEPEIDNEWKVASGVHLQTVKEAIDLYPNARALILTYPNYYGMAYDLESIINYAHIHNIPVLVDEAHGPHFIVGSPFPPSAVQLGADIVVQSAHKTLPAMTMGSYLHVNGNRIEMDRVKDYLQILQSSSPSYPIMASLDIARHYLSSYQQEDVLYLLKERNRFKELLKKISGIKVLTYPNHLGDPLKITIQSTSHLSGFDLQSKLEEQGIFTELADPYNVLMILPLLKENQIYTFEETAGRIQKVLEGITDNEINIETKKIEKKISGLAIPYRKMEDLKERKIPLLDSVDQVSAETIIPYPPGIPLLLKGERITDGQIQNLVKLIESGARFQGGSFLQNGLISVYRTS
ncbi:aminotransferase class I/II-fold pyridoxal phosphate-dependent enzyme [Bacillus salipaludis]|uniref:Aminotransferase class I/II-fold pyridoxal phosphate-dependent enzyme n=1 Tax=Bacillus salipaludis TaxID=2547811 RepID=A0A4V3AT09_9BACI|nr:aminotransferase class I/II-fold pyridoxal phosphate-dependent enzyme [Bacillus salipaludis]MDQ6595366.1 aminotransferase class I/II-fold pyridoxal phosphate-dependent enzyme [Bacillus salipaludis]TDK57131.1 aminotransferase class I/II-fold pyridoxal phosphate-dependent enzyme [Bacillus salipaludis]